MAINCLVCNEIDCGSNNSDVNRVKFESRRYESIAPWVAVDFLDSNDFNNVTISVGNESAPSFGHSAGIINFEYGMSNGQIIKLEIVDEQGGAFELFVDKLAKCVENARTDYSMRIRFGWTTSDCFGNQGPPEISAAIYAIPLDLQVNFEGGLVKYILTAPDPMQMVFNTRELEPIASMELKEAIRHLGLRSEPSFNVEFRKFNDNGISVNSADEWDFDNGGVVSSWPSDGQNKLSTITEWVTSFTVNGGKGIVATWSGTESVPTLILWEDFMPKCNETPSPSRSIGTFIVNGGQCSNVLKFTTTINWAAAFGKLSAGGGTSGTYSGETLTSPENCNVQNNSVGVLTSTAVNEMAVNKYGTDKAAAESAIASEAHSKAGSVYAEGLQAIEAELTIMGNPQPLLTDVRLLVGRTASIIVINPFHIRKGDGDTKEWLAVPLCQKVLTNCTWMITGVNHQIKEGSYTTTLKVFLPVPGIDLSSDQGMGNYFPENVC